MIPLRTRWLTAVLAATVTAALAGCQSITALSPPVPVPLAQPSAPAGTSAPSAEPYGAAAASARPLSADDPVDRVLAISIDGLNPRAITELGAEKTPSFHRLMREGTWTFNARTEWEQTRTLPNHTGMLSGRRVDARSGGHGVTFNTDTGKTVHQAAGHYVSSVFDVVHDRGGSTSLYSTKTKFDLYRRTWNTKGRPDTVGRNNGRAKIDDVVLDTDAKRLTGKLTAQLRKDPATFTFLHISLPDAAGHASGFMGPQYLTSVVQTDKLLGQVLTTISSRSSLRKHTMVVLTADHGGNGASHSDPTKLANYRIPFMAWGPGVPAGRDLYAINSTMSDPGTTRPGYRGKQPIRNGDVANLTTDLLDLATVPGSELDRPRTLDLFGS